MRSASIPNLLGTVLLGFSLVGCTVIGHQRGTPVTAKEQDFSVGRSTYTDVLAKIGPPSKLSVIPGGMVFLYEYVQLSEGQINVRSDDILGLIADLIGDESDTGFSALSLVRISYAEAAGKSAGLLFVFEDGGTLRSVRSFRGKLDLGSSVGLAPPVLWSEQIDKSAYLKKTPQHRWGMALLRPLRRGLNRQQDLDSGRHGIERLGTPKGTGQRTLE